MAELILRSCRDCPFYIGSGSPGGTRCAYPLPVDRPSPAQVEASQHPQSHVPLQCPFIVEPLLIRIRGPAIP